MTDRTAPRTPRAPAGLGPRGRRLWVDTVAVFDLRPDELATLEECARTTDVLARLEHELATSDVVVVGSTGQPRPNPLLGEVRGHRLVLARLLSLLALDDVPEDGEDGARPTVGQVRAQRAAQARWARPSRAHGGA